MRILVSIQGVALEQMAQAQYLRVTSLAKWISRDCFILSPTEAEMKMWSAFMQELPKDLSISFSKIVSAFMLDRRFVKRSECGHEEGLHLILSSKDASAQRCPDCGTETIAWTNWADSEALDRIHQVRITPLIQGASRTEELKPRFDIFYRFSTTVVVVDRYLAMATKRAGTIPGVEILEEAMSGPATHLKLISSDKEAAAVTLLKVEASKILDSTKTTLVACKRDYLFMKHVHHRMLGFVIKGNVYSVSLDKGLESLANDPIAANTPIQFLSRGGVDDALQKLRVQDHDLTRV